MESMKETDHWTEQSGEDLAAAVFAEARRVRDGTSARRDMDLRNIQLYQNFDTSELLPSQPDVIPIGEKISLNVCRSVVDTAVSKLAKAVVRPVFVTERGNYSQQRRAQRLDAYIDGLFYQQGWEKKRVRWIQHCAALGTGVLKVAAGRDGVVIENRNPWEVLVDEHDGYYGSPRQIIEAREPVEKRVLKRMFPEQAEGIEESAGWEAWDPQSAGERNDSKVPRAAVLEAWWLPSYEGAGDGRHVVVTSAAVLVDEEWTLDRHPFEFIRWSDRHAGVWGAGIVEDIAGIQYEINRILEFIRKSMILGSSLHAFVQSGSGINPKHMTNEVATLIEYTGDPPIYVTPQTVHPEVYAHLMRLVQLAYEQPGISMLSAQGRKPAGLDSGAALREYSDIESERLFKQGKEVEMATVRVADLVVQITSAMKKKPTVLARGRALGRSFVKKLEWNDVRMDRDSYAVQILPASALPTTISGRTATIEHWLNAGMISKDQALSLLDLPDIQGFADIRTAHMRRVMADIEKMEDGEMALPSPMLNLEMAKQLVDSEALRIEADGADESVMSLFRAYSVACAEMLNAMMQQMAAQQAAAQPPAGVPMQEGVPE